MKRVCWSAGLAAALLLNVLGTTAEAGPILGSFSISGNFLAVKASGDPATLDLATGIDFIDLFGSDPTPGVEGEFLVNSAKGDFAGLTGQSGSIRDFSFAGVGTSSFPSTPISSLQSVGGVTFDLLTVAVVLQSSDFLVLSGTGVFHIAGFDDTSGTFKLTGNGEDGTFSFSASDKASSVAVPEAGSGTLLGIALFCAAIRRSRQRIT